VVAGLLSARQMNADILPTVGRMLGSSASEALQRRIIEALGGTADTAVGPLLAEAYPKLPTGLQGAVFAQMIKRSEWSLALVDALKSGNVTLNTLGPANVHRLRTHSDSTVSKRANAVLDELRGPELKEKNALLARFTPEVEKAGDATKGKALFTQNCAVCHKLNGEGKDAGPDLTGMGAHGAAELLVAVLDPNREVDPSFIAWSIETKDGESYEGMIARENQGGVLLRNNSGEMEIKTADIKARRATGRSLMPEGFEVLGADGLRHVLTYICGSDAKYRLLDLRNAFTADSTKGIYNTPESVNESLVFKKFGLAKVGDVPFEILHPNKTTAGKNVVVLKGGSGFAKTLPQKVEIRNVGLKAGRLHFLGGVGGWAYPCCGENKNENLPVAKITVRHSDGEAEEFILKNGVEIADYNGTQDVPGSKPAWDLLQHGQVRTFSRPLKSRAPIDKITLESFDNAVAPTFVAITAEIGEAGAGPYADASAAAATRSDVSGTAPFQWNAGIKTLIVGGGASHDFARWFGKEDIATLTASGRASVNYTEQYSAVTPALKDINVLYFTSNQPLNDAALRQGILDFAHAGKGLLLVHPGLWYNWKDWPEYNRDLVGGGASSHDRYGEFEVTVNDTSHPIMAGVPATFKIADELYHFQPDDQGASRQVLATGKSPITGKTYPVVWITKHPQARIVCISLGHDGKAHELPAFKTLLQNSLNWVARK
jgi:putative heme-binding domain-containing protein